MGSLPKTWFPSSWFVGLGNEESLLLDHCRAAVIANGNLLLKEWQHEGDLCQATMISNGKLVEKMIACANWSVSGKRRKNCFWGGQATVVGRMATNRCVVFGMGEVLRRATMINSGALWGTKQELLLPRAG